MPPMSASGILSKHAEEEDAAQLEAADIVGQAARMQTDAATLKEEGAKVKEAWNQLAFALRTDTKEIDKMNRVGATRGLVNLAYLVVILGCEIDLYGFAMAVPGYWNIPDQVFVKGMCVVGPLGYLSAVLMYMWYASGQVEKEAEEKKKREKELKEAKKMRLKYVANPKAQSPELQETLPQETVPPNSKQPIKVRLYHFIPVYRFYLVVKDKDENDIEGVFRVNSLSSFSLGIAQICGIIFYLLANNYTLDTFTMINIISQTINWSLTLLYFITPVSARMGAAMKVETLISASTERLRRKHEEMSALRSAVGQGGQMSSRNKEHLEQFEENLNIEIKTLANVDMDLSMFEMKDKVKALKILHRRMNDVYASI